MFSILNESELYLKYLEALKTINQSLEENFLSWAALVLHTLRKMSKNVTKMRKINKTCKENKFVIWSCNIRKPSCMGVIQKLRGQYKVHVWSLEHQGFVIVACKIPYARHYNPRFVYFFTPSFIVVYIVDVERLKWQ